MTDDIVTRLRHLAAIAMYPAHLCNTARLAADEIERLRAEVEGLRILLAEAIADADSAAADADRAEAEADRWKADADRLADWYDPHRHTKEEVIDLHDREVEAR